MRKLTHEDCTALLSGIKSSVPGAWTHDLNTVCDGPVRFVDRVAIPDGPEIVYFQHPDGAGAWPVANWDRFAVERAPQLVEQMTLF